jgi:single-stranded-DNA-specific exonuclease
MTGYRWQLIPTDEHIVQNLHAAIGLDPLFCRLLAQRGLYETETIQRFFDIRLDDLHNPFGMADMDVAVERLDRALKKGERILLYGDYDVDGTTSVTLMYAFLSGFYRNLDYYLPDRDKEGYGVSLQSVEYAREKGCTLVVAMDCGIKAHAAVDKAHQYGIDYIVCDHHLPEGSLPAAVANLDPKRPDCPYPYKDLSGCGIAYKLAQALAMHNNTPQEELEHLLDLVAVSIACDIVPMTGENRILAHYGLQRLNREPRTGLWALLNRINRSQALDVSDVVFSLGPLINAAGRLGDARDAVRLMLSVDRNAALDYAGKLVHRNRERREVDYATAEEAGKRFREKPGFENLKSIVLYDPGWHKGIIGIAASRLSERYHRPTIILMQSNDRAVGSARSVPGFDLYAALQECEDLFFSYGGHAHAAGMQMPLENVEAFAERFENIARKKISEENQTPVLDISACVRLDDITPEFVRQLRRFEPFGPQNRNPVFCAKGVLDTGYSKLLDNNHVRLSLRHAERPLEFKGVGFGLGDKFAALRKEPFDIAFTVQEDEWKNEKRISLHAKDFQKA